MKKRLTEKKVMQLHEYAAKYRKCLAIVHGKEDKIAGGDGQGDQSPGLAVNKKGGIR